MLILIYSLNVLAKNLKSLLHDFFFMKVRTVLKYAMQYKISKIVNKIFFFVILAPKFPFKKTAYYLL